MTPERLAEIDELIESGKPAFSTPISHERAVIDLRAALDEETQKAAQHKLWLDDIARALHPNKMGTGWTYLPQQLAEKVRQLLLCPVCGGDPDGISDKDCMCGGSGKKSEYINGLVACIHWWRNRYEEAFTKRESEVGSDLFQTFVIYDHPKDYPDHFIARVWLVTPGGNFAGRLLGKASTLDEARKLIPAGSRNMGRKPGDDPKIAEVWL